MNHVKFQFRNVLQILITFFFGSNKAHLLRLQYQGVV